METAGMFHLAEFRSRNLKLLVPEVAYSGKQHRDSEAVGSFNDLRITLRASGLDDGRGAGFGDFFDAVGKWEEGVGCGDSALQRELSFHGADFGGIDARHLPGADPDRLSVTSVDN